MPEAADTWDCAYAVKEGWDKQRVIYYMGANRLDRDEFRKLAATR